jgi:hypothetical protein
MKCVPGNPSDGILKPFDCISVEVIDDDIDYNSKPGTFQPSLAESNHSLTDLLTTGNLQLACPESCNTRANTKKCYDRGNICESTDHIVLLALRPALNCTTATILRHSSFFSNVMTEQVTDECPDTCVDDGNIKSAGHVGRLVNA